jgi:hypothetical protein
MHDAHNLKILRIKLFVYLTGRRITNLSLRIMQAHSTELFRGYTNQRTAEAVRGQVDYVKTNFDRVSSYNEEILYYN